MPRHSIHIESLSHLTPIPVATRIGPLVTCSITAPFNPGTRELPPDIGGQIANLFHHVGAMLAEAGGTWDNVAKMTFYAPDPSEIFGALNAVWEEHFPEPASRPSRHTMVVPDDKSGIRVCCDFIAYIEG